MPKIKNLKVKTQKSKLKTSLFNRFIVRLLKYKKLVSVFLLITVYSLLFTVIPAYAGISFSHLGSVVDSDSGTGTYFGVNTTIANINGDNYQGLLIGAHGATNGRLYVFYGGEQLDNSADIIIDEQTANFSFPASHSRGIKADDLNNDGYDDILVSNSEYCDPVIGDYAGKSYIFFGERNFTKTSTSEADIEIIGNGAIYLHGASTYIAEVNGDGNEDLVISSRANGAEGQVEIYYGNGSKTIDATLDKTLAVSGSRSLGADSIRAGDINGDGFNDIFVGEYYWDTGIFYIFYGGEDMSSAYAVKFTAENSSDKLTYGASDIKDINNDGYDDVCMGASDNDQSGTDSGRVYCFFGSSNFSGDKSVTDADIIYNGSSAGDNFGKSLKLNDINNDGNVDLIVGAFQYDGADEGYVNIYYGNGVTLNTNYDIQINSTDFNETNKNFGSTVLIGDFDNDGWTNLFISSYKGGVKPQFLDTKI